MQTHENGLLSEITYLRDNPQSNSHLDATGKPHDLTYFLDKLWGLIFKLNNFETTFFLNFKNSNFFDFFFSFVLSFFVQNMISQTIFQQSTNFFTKAPKCRQYKSEKAN